jgi:hypothetical protein
MTIYRCLNSAPLGAAPSIIAALAVGRFRNREQRQQQAALDDWEDEGGRVMAADVAAPAPGSSDKKTEGRFGLRGRSDMGQPSS